MLQLQGKEGLALQIYARGLAKVPSGADKDRQVCFEGAFVMPPQNRVSADSLVPCHIPREVETDIGTWNIS